ncbi:MAG: hypothetical protein V3U18_04850 [Alphaproteobacteria bacterium]
MTLPLGDMSVFSVVAERDIDLVLLEELHVSPSFRTWFVQSLFGETLQMAKFVGAWHSVTDASLGESDLILAFIPEESDQTTAVLIENKITAAFQDSQAERYRRRGDKGQENGWWQDFCTCLVAPQKYLEASGDVAFDWTLSYEDIAGWFAASGQGARGAFKEKLLREGIEQNRRGWEMIPDAAVMAFFRAYWEIASKDFPDLRYEFPGKLPAGGTWPCFRNIGLTKGVVIYHKAEQGFVDLSFSSAASEDVSGATESLLDEDMVVVQTGKSAVVRIVVPALNCSAPFQTQEEQVRMGLRAAQRLLEFYRKNARQLSM